MATTGALDELAALSDLLPAAPKRRRWLRWPRRRPAKGLAGIPERYRLQFLLLAAERMPGRAPEEVSALAGRLAQRFQPPPPLVAALATETGPLDEWFRDRAEAVVAELDRLVA